MAGDLYDVDWGDDPFDGDIDFDMDFNTDPFSNKSFMGGVASGFLSGVVNETVGSGAARMRTLRTVLPDSYSNALDKANFVGERISELAQEFREENSESAKSLQNIAGKLSQRMGSKLPGFMNDGLTRFSEKDFSDWEKYDANSYNPSNEMGETDDDEIKQVIDSVVMAQSGMFSALGDTLNQMTAQVGANLHSSINAGNRQLVNIEGSVRDLMNYQRTVQAKIHQGQLSIAARSYVQDTKFYKFMEKALHTEIGELKRIVRNTGLSDYEKTSNYTASKAYVRGRLFNTVGKRMGGLTGMMREKFGKENRTEAYGALGTIIGGVSDAMDMSEGAPMSRGMVGNILGNMIAGVAVEQLPIFFQRGPGKQAIDKLMKAYPEQAVWIKAQVKQITDIGNVISYASTSGVGVANSMAENYQPMDEMKFLDYQDYLSSLKPGDKPIPKALWTVMNTAGNGSKSAINKLMTDMSRSKGTQYSLTRRNVKDLNQPGIWQQMNNVTLNEVIPGLISRTNQILEQIRTGTNEVERESFNYMRGQFQTESDKRVAVQADLMPHSDFLRYATAALELVDSLDPKKLLSSGARKALAKQIAKDIDAEKGFNPYYYLGDIPGMSESYQKEVKDVLKLHFGIEDSNIDEYSSADSFGKMKVMMKMPTEQGRERLNATSASAANIKENFPNVAERIDLLRSTGNEQMLRDLGVIYTENGIDKVNVQLFHDRIGQYMDDPNNPALRGQTKTSNSVLPTVSGGLSTRPTTAPQGNTFGQLNDTLGLLNDNIGKLTQVSQPDPTTSTTASFDTSSGEITIIKDNTSGILAKVSEMAIMLGEFNKLAQAGKLLSGPPQSASDERAEERTKESIINKFRKSIPTDIAGKGLDLLMRNSPLVMGGLLGGLGASFASNPLMAVSLGGAGLMAGAYMQWRQRGKGASVGAEPNDGEDILDEKGEPILTAAKLNMGNYIDAVTRKVITKWSEIKGPIYDTAERVTIGARQLAGKIFGPDGRTVALRGLRAVSDAAASVYNLADPIGRIRSLIDGGKDLIYKQDVYVKGETSPRLLAIKFKANEYFVRNANGEMVPLNGWNEITGPVYDADGETLIAENEIGNLVTAAGQVVSNVGNAAANIAGAGKGLITNFSKTAMAWAAGKLGMNASPGTDANGQSTASSSGSRQRDNAGVERRLDLIYKMLSQQFGIPMEEDEDLGIIGGVVGGLRLNSLAFKEQAAKEEEKHQVNQAIIEIAKNTKGMGGDEEDKGDKKGLWGTLRGLVGGMGGFMMKLFKNPLGTIGGLIGGSLLKSTKLLGKIGMGLFSGVLGAASPIFKLLKAGFSKLAMALGAARLGGALGGGVSQRGQSGRRGGRGAGARGGSKLGRRGRGLMGLAAGAGASYLGAQFLSGDEEDIGVITDPDTKVNERDPTTGHYRTAGDEIVDTVTSWLPQGQLAKAAVDGLLPKEVKAKTDEYGLWWATDGKMFLSRSSMESHEDELRGVAKPDGSFQVTKPATGIYSTQKRIRFAMYGIADTNTGLARRVEYFENLLYPYVNIMNGRAAFKANTPIEKLLQEFANAGNTKFEDKDAIATWFMARFKPIFMIYNAAVSIAKMGDLNEFDESKQYDVIQVIERVQQSIASLDPYPYSIDVRIDQKTALLPDVSTRKFVDLLMEKLRTIIPAPETSIEKIATTEQRRAQVEAGADMKQPNMGYGGASSDKMGILAAQAAQEEVDRKWKTPEQVKEINIVDLMPGKDDEMDPFIMARLAAYGNVDNMSWRVEAVLKLERYIENFMMVVGEDVRFTGQSGRVLELFKPMFRIENDQGSNNWMIWFRDRFLPVMMTYTKEIKRYRGTLPASGWKQLSDTNRVVIARKLCEQLVSIDGEQKSVWDIEASPFPRSKSGKWSDKANKYLKILDAKSQEATLKDPELEASKSSTVQDRISPDQQAQASNMRERTEKALNDVYGTTRQATTGSYGVGGGGTGTSYTGMGSVNDAPDMVSGGAGSAGQFGGKANENFNPEFIKKAGEDKGIKMSPEQGEQLMLNHLVKAGFTDNKVLALALAMAKKETGNYSATVENTNWSAPTLLKYFKNIPDQATAQKVAAMSPAERAMWVYGRAPKGPSLGNTKPEDGFNYRGRGLFQLTGKANYERFKKQSGIDVVSNPRLVSEDPNVMAESAVNFLKNSPAMKAIAKTGDFNTAVRGINGGNAVPATDERRTYYNEYLNRLRNGEMGIPEGGQSEGVDSNPAPVGAPSQELPNAADKNVPEDQIVNPEVQKAEAAKPVGKGSVKDLLDQADSTSKASNVGTMPTTSSSVSSVDDAAESTPAAGSTATGADSLPSTPTTTGGNPTEAYKSEKATTSTVSAPIPQPTRPEAPTQVKAEVTMPDMMRTQDVGVATALVGVSQTLNSILKQLEKSGRGNGVVNMG